MAPKKAKGAKSATKAAAPGGTPAGKAEGASEKKHKTGKQSVDKTADGIVPTASDSAQPSEPLTTTILEPQGEQARKVSLVESVKDTPLAVSLVKPGDPEWNSKAVRDAKLTTGKDGFSCCIVVIMEDSPDLSKYGEFLLRAVESGVRKKFMCISGAQTAERVKRFMINTGQRDPQATDDSFMAHQDLFAEAVKCSLITLKDAVTTEMDVDSMSREMELSGARSKDYIRYIPPLTLTMPHSSGSAGGGDADIGIREPPPPPPPTEIGINATPEKPRKSSKKHKEEEIAHADPTPPPDDNPALNRASIGVKTKMRKRGELPMPEFEVVDDTPAKGPQSFVLLQGFYNPRIIDELRQIGVIVDGILLMTDETVTRYNFSIMDVEDSIPGTFRPRNVLPQYLKAMEKLFQDPETQNTDVVKFWAGLSEMYNAAPIDSPFHDIALMNFRLPDVNKFQMDTNEGLTMFMSKVFDEVARRVFEMLILNEWFHEFKAAAAVTKLQPLEPALSRDIYEQIVGKIPAECVSVPIMLEAVVQQVAYTLDREAGRLVPDPCYEEDIISGIVMGKSSFGSTNWGTVAPPPPEEETKVDSPKVDDDVSISTGTQKSSVISTPKPTPHPLFRIPLYIKAGDYASIRSCHLNEGIAAKIASCQLSGDMRNIQGFLWNNVPLFNPGLYKKLLGNLNHFMYFLPPDLIRYEDMFYILHLLMSAGVEVQMQKKAAEARASQKNDVSFLDVVKKPSTMLMTNDVYYHTRPDSGSKFPGTNLDMDHNYLAVHDKTGVHLVIAPTSNQELTISSFGHTPQTQPQQPQPPQPAPVETPAEGEARARFAEGEKTKSKKKRKYRKTGHTPKQSVTALDPSKAARVTTAGAIETAAEFAKKLETDANAEEEDLLNARRHSKRSASVGSDKKRRSTTTSNNEGKDLAFLQKDFTESKAAFATSKPALDADKKRFIACEEEFFEDIHDTSVIQALLECPALLAISESGALDLSKWVERYLFSYGMDIGGGEGVLLGDLKNWNYIEELVPIQVVQMLNEATKDYLSMQRMYCPFYDTLLFIFNNPTPKELTAETQFYTRLKTLPGLQHFLEYTMTDDNVLKWIEQMDSSKRLEVGESCSLNTLLTIIPEEQWLLVPSIKYQIMVDNAAKKSASTKVLYNNSAILPESAQKHSSRGSVTTQLKDETGRTSIADGKGIEEGGAEETPATTRGSKDLSVTPKDEKRASAEMSPPPPPPSESEAEEVKRASEEEIVVNLVDILEEKPGSPEGFGLIQSSLNFTCYDLGKRVAVVGNDTFYVFPLDGTLIRYDISTIEPEFRMMQLTVTKNGHQTYFYPYYIPHDFDLSQEDYVVCPYFHMVLSNGTIFAFQDLRAEQAAPYMKVALKEKPDLFSFEKVLFGREVEQKLQEVARAASAEKEKEEEEAKKKKKESKEHKSGAASQHELHPDKKKSAVDETPPDQSAADKAADAPTGEQEHEQGGKKGKKNKEAQEKKSKKLHGDKAPEVVEKEKPKKSAKEEKLEKKSKKKLDGTNKPTSGAAGGDETEEHQEHPASPPPTGDSHAQGGPSLGETEVGIGNTPTATPTEAQSASMLQPAPPLTEEEGAGGEWMYPSSENSEDESTDDPNKRRLFFAPPWDNAIILVQPLVHVFKATLPSGLLVTVEDLPGPPLARVVKQSYFGQGSARPLIESSRYYTMDGSVIKFLFNGNIQVLTARGVTTTIDEIAANSKRDIDNLSRAFGAATIVKIFNGEVILPNGGRWQVLHGKKVIKNPVYVFTSGPLAGGEIFRRRQDGVIYLHRYDGTVITHYPDGTRFTSRMVVQETPSEEFQDWVFVGLKYLVEHPNYCTVLFNTLSGNTHVKLPNEEWVRVFADGSIRIATEDNYKLDVDKNRAILSYPPCAKGSESLPNLVVTRLWHSAKESPVQSAETVEEEDNHEDQGEAVATAGPENVETPQPQQQVPEPEDPAKRRSRSDIGGESRDKLNLHPKVKQREQNKRQRGTKFDAPGDEGIRSSVMSATKPEDSPGEAPPPEDSKNETEEGRGSEDVKPQRKQSALRDGDGTLADFLEFTDETTFCKAIDSWDNRFAMNIYGGVIVDKLEKEESAEHKSSQELIEALSEHCSVSKDYFAGILKNTSSANLSLAARRLNAYRQSYSESCSGTLPKTKIFVVKRDLTGFQFLQKDQVDETVAKAYGSRDSMVLFDPLPKRQPRKFITIMRPVEEEEHSHGMWTRPYIEPMFRPRNVTNKHLRVANPNDLRWFGYVVVSAHGKRPRFVADGKERFRQWKEVQEMLTDIQTTFDNDNMPASTGDYEEAAGEEEEEETFEEEQQEFQGEYEDEEEMQGGGEDIVAQSERGSTPSVAAKLANQASIADLDKKRKKKKDGKESENKDKAKEKVDAAKKLQAKPKDKKGKGKESTEVVAEEEEEPEKEQTEDEEEEMSQHDPAPDPPTSQKKRRTVRKRRNNNLDEPQVGEYPPEIQDIKGIYEMKDDKPTPTPRISVQSHSTADCNTKKAVVVRAFVEIPKVDENIQRALLAASMSYAETVKSETLLFKSYKQEDPRTPEERLAQAEIKQQLIEQNVDEMHLLEQKPGPVLKFHF